MGLTLNNECKHLIMKKFRTFITRMNFLKQTVEIAYCEVCCRHLFLNFDCGRGQFVTFENNEIVVNNNINDDSIKQFRVCPVCNNDGFTSAKINESITYTPRNVFCYRSFVATSKLLWKYDQSYRDGMTTNLPNRLRQLQRSYNGMRMMNTWGIKVTEDNKVLGEDNREIVIFIYLMSYDGVEVYKSGIKSSVSPVTMMNMSLPDDMLGLKEYMLLTSLCNDLHNPNLMMKVIKEEFLYYQQQYSMKKTNQLFILFGVTSDIKAQEKLLGLRSCSFVYGCGSCTEPSVSVSNSSANNNGDNIANVAIRFDKRIWYFEDKVQFPMRSLHNAYVNLIDENANSKGYCAISPLSELPGFDIYEQHAVDLMHAIENIGFILYLNVKSIRIALCNFMDDLFTEDKIMLTIDFGRKLRSMEHCKNFKAEEWQSILLYWWPVAVTIYTSKMRTNGTITEEWKNIESIIYGLQNYLLLLQKQFSINVLSKLQVLAKDLKKLFRVLLPENIYTITLHRFLDHSAHDFARNGALFLRSCKRFERSYTLLREVSQNATVNFVPNAMLSSALVTYVNLCLANLSNPEEHEDFCKTITKLMRTDIHLRDQQKDRRSSEAYLEVQSGIYLMTEKNHRQRAIKSIHVKHEHTECKFDEAVTKAIVRAMQPITTQYKLSFYWRLLDTKKW